MRIEEVDEWGPAAGGTETDLKHSSRVAVPWLPSWIGCTVPDPPGDEVDTVLRL